MKTWNITYWVVKNDETDNWPKKEVRFIFILKKNEMWKCYLKLKIINPLTIISGYFNFTFQA